MSGDLVREKNNLRHIEAHEKLEPFVVTCRCLETILDTIKLPLFLSYIEGKAISDKFVIGY